MNKAIKKIIEKILFVIPPWDLWENQEDDMYPNGLGCLVSVLEKDYKVDVVDLTNSKLEDIKESFKNKLIEFNPDVLGISMMSNNRVSSLKLMNFSKEIKDLIIIAGGVHATCMPEQVINNFPVDYLVLGEGEIALAELLKNLNKGGDLSKVKGIMYKKDGKIIRTEPGERIKNLDSIPFPKHELFRKIIEKYDYAQIMSSRGCPFSCVFCPSSVHWGRWMIQRSPKNVADEMEHIIKTFPNVKSIKFCDDELICNNKWINELCNLIIERGINKKIRWYCFGRVTSISEDKIKIMKKAGCFRVIFGIESASQTILNNARKMVKVEDIINAVTICKKNNLEVGYLTIVGLPGENSKTVRESMKVAIKLKCVAEPAILIIYPGTEVYRLAKEKGQLTDDYWLTEGLCPLYTCEHSKARLFWWSFKTGVITHIFADDGNLKEYLKRRIFNKLNPHNFNRVIRKYITNSS